MISSGLFEALIAGKSFRLYTASSYSHTYLTKGTDFDISTSRLIHDDAFSLASSIRDEIDNNTAYSSEYTSWNLFLQYHTGVHSSFKSIKSSWESQLASFIP